METLIFYTYEFAASILPFSAAFIFLSHKQKKGGEKTHLLPGLLLFLFAVYIVCVYHVTGTGTLWDAFLYRFQTEISHINPIPFSAGILRNIKESLNKTGESEVYMIHWMYS